jgi:molybdopterin-guanine dinucleotide biosynthesis protein A
MSHLGEQPPWLKAVFDKSEYSDKGPLTGLLSCMAQLRMDQNEILDPEISFDGLLVLGCDYRNMTEETLGRLVAVGQTQNRICCYQNHITGFIEPLVAYYPAEILQQIPEFAKENSSLRQFVEAHNPCILPTDIQTLQTLRSFDQ